MPLSARRGPSPRGGWGRSTIAELKTALTRERRSGERRVGRPDTRFFQYERRVGQRRAGRGEDGEPIEDDMIIEVTVEDDVAVAATVVALAGPFTDDDAFDAGDLIRIRDRLVL